MTPAAFLRLIVDPTLQWLAPLVSIPVSDQARVLLMAIAGQESSWTDRLQGGGGPARGYWQFEGETGATGQVFSTMPKQLQAVCDMLAIPFEGSAIFDLIAWNDTLACSMARLLLWQDPAALPKLGDIDEAWTQYLRNWRPGSPSRDRWDSVYPIALDAVEKSSHTP